MKLLSLFAALLLSVSAVYAKGDKEEFTIVKEVKHTPVISQGRTGTCWSFATTSFLESEIMRKGFPETNLSEMFFVYYNYKNKAFQYLLYHGKNNFGEGSLSHDVLKVVADQGVMLYDAFPGIQKDGKYNHTALIKELRDETDKIDEKKRGKIDVSDLKSFKPVLKSEIGKLPNEVEIAGKKYSATELRDKYEINPDDYIELTSFSHHPFWEQCVVEVPDNWAHASYYNLPLDDLLDVMYYALNNGFSVAWDGDTSEKTFVHKEGKADVPKKLIGKVDQEERQKTFFDRTTTDDHLMHLVGLSKDAEGKDCFYTKNSWGAASNEYGGYLHMTEDYVRLKTIGIMVHKDAIPEKIKSKLKL
ncbi:C1 family peptidase [uncultured Draconibacterium sp.]|uniref:C1 family peptidase n=1 Tax=uncultured Draconibacterium sp. TaxID=1573823 RepID=UPI002AA7CCE9|nr:C1 family peptidase [uncultured Draconibacterium sp.]